MAIEINVPDIGADEVEVTEILVSVGDKVEEEQSLITVEGDKASMEVPASQAGIVKEIKIAEGDKVSTGSLIMIFEAEGALQRLLQRQKLLLLRQQHLQRLNLKKYMFQILAVMK
ncbi:Dihydrolipoamide acetyltransferase component of pyruvate dehydrogenase complex [Vibrio aestuarianus]|nr:Dihydrolipoamide acetyltransferase component of pyruvate dehydrogenase complex [Vibrio aestuarianus]